ncbi:hypothetical protein SAMN05444920_11663 [Nonomuraea solani]|uniref:Uncharacterized protein n=1 Tax=Nonomuraea solani TaxID=1144553 RepID=A0A1H6EU30_9ACTN|nr:hypothetical protein [Nonomuraea solani]SEH00329.1 hypothetical protein SAMN05444920_11663 [Nonomuraea solani]
MGSDLRRGTVDGTAVHTAEFIVSSARLTELHECSAVLRRTRMRSEEIVDEARALLDEAEQRDDTAHILDLRDQLERARTMYCKVLNAYLAITRRINEERQEILRAQMELDRRTGLSGAA